MASGFALIRPLVHALPPETAHTWGIRALQFGLVPDAKPVNEHVLKVHVWGMEFPNPVGLAAGFDKNAAVTDALLRQGFGFVEAGTVTPRPQSGNAKPRMFRLSEDEAVINRLGFNNQGLIPFVQQLAHRKEPGIVGANIGKNKDSEDAVSDYVQGLQSVYAVAEYVTINISSPNTAGLRALQKSSALDELLGALKSTHESLVQSTGKRKPLLLKIAPDLNEQECEDIARLALAHGIDGLIVSNTTISRPSLKSTQASEQGGLSGKPLFTLATQTLKDMYRLTGGKLPLIGVGGIASPEDAYAKIRAGATLVQLYSALAYQGFGLVRHINLGLSELLARDGFSQISDAIGTGADSR